ncbi:MAG: hypothetical protein GX117_06635 [Candidatus Hydrogenedentes bacterium]|jgi:hypothetical protein|nr:hypothetical protein [Candidatus Hydrogenedentota bacterium]
MTAKYRRFSKVKCCIWRLTLLGILLAGGSAYAEDLLTAEPSTLVFNTIGEKQWVQLSLNGQLLAPSAIKGWSFLTGGRSYTHMILVTPTEKGLLIGPSLTAEVGSYELLINTRHGTVKLSVSTPFKGQESILEKTMHELGISEEEARAQLGFSQRFEREQISLNLPSVYFVGDLLEIEVPENGNLRCVWKVNGATVLEGFGQRLLRHKLSFEGPLEVRYEEWQGETLLAADTAQSSVLRRPPIHVDTTVNTTTTFRGPANYKSYEWYIETAFSSYQPSISHVFMEPGLYRVVCVSGDPLDDSLKQTREDVFEVTVK